MFIWVKIQKLQKRIYCEMSFPSSSVPLSGETNMVTVLDKLPEVPYAYSSKVDYFHKNKISKDLLTKQFQ